jgi:hypothetical protein
MMGLKSTALNLLEPLIRGDVLCLGYPDLLIPFEIAQRKYGAITPTENGARHGLKFSIPETTEVFMALGAKTVRYVDIAPSRGVEEKVDLNLPLSLGAYDLVIDPGTTEHCFNVGQAVENAAMAVKEGGHVFHTPPCSMVNHGFWNFNPTTLLDYYSQNGFTVIGQWFERGDITMPIETPTARLQLAPEHSIYCLARRSEMRDFLVWPTQSKYRKDGAP